jgi:cation transport regulator ChaC
VGAADAPEVLERLDERERGGYERHRVSLDLHESAQRVDEALVYVATSENPNYLGEAELGEIAAQVLRARGPSGANLEYVLRLAGALREMSAHDEHVFALEALLLERSGLDEPGLDGPG